MTFIEKDMYNILNAVAHYLDKSQPMELQVLLYIVHIQKLKLITFNVFYRINVKSSIKNCTHNIPILYGYIYNRWLLMNMSINQKMNDFHQSR